MESIEKWYTREVYRWRTGAAVSWSLIILPVVCVIYLAFTCVEPLNPFNWITGFFLTVFSGSFVFLVCVALVVNGLFYVYSSRTYTVLPDTAITRLAQFFQLFKPSCLLYCGVCAGTGAILVWACTGVLGDRYNGLSYRCTTDSDLFCINERHLFLVLYGGFTGVMYGGQHFISQQNCLHFPLLQTKALPVLWKSACSILWHVKFFYIGYYLLGNIPRDWIAGSLSLKFGSDYRLDTLYGLLTDLPLLWHAVLAALFIHFSWSFGALLYKVYNTEHIEFPMSSMFEDFKNKRLVDGMSCTTDRLVQALSFFDLDILSKHSPARRKELFSLSQPGGHPHNWNSIVSVCLAVVNELGDKVQDANWKILSSVPVRQPSGEKQVFTGPAVSSVGNGASSGTEGVKFRGPADSQQTQAPSVQLKEKVLMSLRKRPVFSFFLSELPEARSRQLFASSQLQIWAVEALANLVSASYTEDTYGVVQISLPDIIRSVLNLQEQIDKHFKLTGGVSRRGQKEQPNVDLPLRYSLQTIVKSSIYKIIDTFGKHTMELRLPLETEKKIKNFMEYRE